MPCRQAHNRGAQQPAGLAGSDNLQVNFDIRFCRAQDGTRIAFARRGHGPVLVKSAIWMTHLELDRRSIMWRHWYDEPRANVLYIMMLDIALPKHIPSPDN